VTIKKAVFWDVTPCGSCSCSYKSHMTLICQKTAFFKLITVHKFLLLCVCVLPTGAMWLQGTDNSMYSHFTLTWGNSELRKCWIEGSSGGVWIHEWQISCQQGQFDCPALLPVGSGKTYLAGKRYPCTVGFMDCAMRRRIYCGKHKHQTSHEVRYKSCWGWGRPLNPAELEQTGLRLPPPPPAHFV
jgi:hypothetical protein